MVDLLSRRRATVLTLACALVLLVFSPGGRPSLVSVLQAQASDPAPGLYELVAMHSGKCLDVYGESTDDAALVIQWSCHGSENQHWRVESTGDGYFNLLANHSGKALDVSQISLEDGAQVIQYTPNGGPNQQWQFHPLGGNVYTLTARHSGKALDVTGASPDDGAQLSFLLLQAGFLE